MSATFIHLKSESCDHYYIARHGLLTDAQVEEVCAEFFAGTGDDYGETVFIEHVERLPDPADSPRGQLAPQVPAAVEQPAQRLL